MCNGMTVVYHWALPLPVEGSNSKFIWVWSWIFIRRRITSRIEFLLSASIDVDCLTEFRMENAVCLNSYFKSLYYLFQIWLLYRLNTCPIIIINYLVQLWQMLKWKILSMRFNGKMDWKRLCMQAGMVIKTMMYTTLAYVRLNYKCDICGVFSLIHWMYQLFLDLAHFILVLLII